MFWTIFGILCYLRIGGALGKNRWEIWHKEQSYGIVPFLHFPMSYRGRTIGTRPKITECNCPFCKITEPILRFGQTGYTIFTAFTWPIPVLWTLFYTTLSASTLAAKAVVFGPSRILDPVRRIQPPKAKPALQVSSIDRLTALRADRERIDREIEEIRTNDEATREADDIAPAV